MITLYDTTVQVYMALIALSLKGWWPLFRVNTWATQLLRSFLKTQFLSDKLNGDLGGAANNYLCTCDLYTPVHNVLEAWIYITWGSWRGLGPGIPEFFGPCEMASSR